MDIQNIHIEVVGFQLHIFEYSFERHGDAVVQGHHLIRLRPQRALDVAQQMFLIHAGSCVDVSVHFSGRKQNIL